MGDTPFAMSFDEIKAQAEANMQADKGGTAAPQPAAAASTAAQPTAQKSFRDMVEEAERELAGEGEKTTKEAPASTPAATAEAAESAIPGNISFDELYAQAGSASTPTETGSTSAAGSMSFDDLVKQANEGTTQQAVQPEPVKETSEPVSQPQPAATPNSFDALMADALAQTKAEETENAGTATGISFDNIIAQMETANKPTPMTENAMNPPVETPTEAPVETPVEAKTEAPVEAKTETPIETPVETPIEAKTEAPVETPIETPVEAKTEAPAETPVEAKIEAKKTGKKSGAKKDKKAEEPKEPLPDTTNEYRVDVLGEGDPKASKDQNKESADVQPISFDTLFTNEEIAAFRADIRAFVRKEFKAAMVDVVKELLTNFSE